jgi:TolB protein
MKPRSPSSQRLLTLTLLILISLNLVFMSRMVFPLFNQQKAENPFSPEEQVQAAAATLTPSPTASPRPPQSTDTPVPILLPNALSPEEALRAEGVLILSMRDGANAHLFAYHPLYLPLTRLTNNAWDDITPAVSPDGMKLAYSSRQNGYWDLYIFDLVSGVQSRVTDTPEYEASPTWSPDGQWIAYERYDGANLDIFIQSLTDPDLDPIQLTDDAAADRAPAWSPLGREIAFISTRTGDEEIWLARLDNVDDRFVNLSRSPLSREHFPVWSPGGEKLAWTHERNGERRLVVTDSDSLDKPAILTSESSQSAWGLDGNFLYTIAYAPNHNSLTAYLPETGRPVLPLTPLPGAVYGMTWAKGPLFGWLAEKIQNSAPYTAEILWQPVLTKTVSPTGRQGLVLLEDVSAPQPMLHDSVDEAYAALREQIAAECGWDTLSSLENAYIALTTPPTPSIQNDWLYTGRAFAINPLLLSAGWVTIAREDFSGQTYWRVYLKARYQDGSMGMPLPEMVWDISARYSGNAVAYEEGGKLGQTPPGYWIDMTELARRYDWERLPAHINWRTFYPSIRFNQFAITGGLDWHQAMAELYPPEALVTSTSVPTAAATPTQTPRIPTRVMTATPTPTFTLAPTRRPTWTPAVSNNTP